MEMMESRLNIVESQIFWLEYDMRRTGERMHQRRNDMFHAALWHAAHHVPENDPMVIETDILGAPPEGPLLGAPPSPTPTEDYTPYVPTEEYVAVMTVLFADNQNPEEYDSVEAFPVADDEIMPQEEEALEQEYDSVEAFPVADSINTTPFDSPYHSEDESVE